jgi:hypothetical protein
VRFPTASSCRRSSRGELWCCVASPVELSGRAPARGPPRTLAQKTRLMKSNLPRAIPNLRSCTEMLTRWSPSELNLRSSPAGFEFCWSTWASPPLPGTGSRKSRVLGEWSSRLSQRFSSDPGSFADTRDQPSGLRVAMLLPMPPSRPSHHGSVATRAGCRTRSTSSYPTG